jgi:hypothetical protein
MKTLATLAITTTLLALASGCSKQDQDQAPAVSAPRPSATAVTEDAKNAAGAVQEQAAGVQKSVTGAIAEVKDQAAAVKDTAAQAASDAQTALTSKAQSMLESAQKLIAEKNWTAALKTLGDLGGLKLSPEQQATLASLKEQAQKLAQEAASSKVANQAEKAVGDLLKK